MKNTNENSLKLLEKDLCNFMIPHGITTVFIKYSGFGDSGQIDTIELEGDNMDVIGKQEVLLNLPVSESLRQAASRQHHNAGTLAAALETFVYDWLEERHAGWEDNDGACGVVEINCKMFKTEKEHISYFTDSYVEKEVL